MQQLMIGESRVVLLRRVWNDYRNIRPLKNSSREAYTKYFAMYLSDWADRSIASIRKEEVYQRHQEITRTRGGTTANNVMRLLRGLYNFAQTRYEDSQGYPVFRVNPVSCLSALRCWNRERPRRRYIQAHQMQDWFLSVSSLKNGTIRDFLLFILHTGLRRSEACGLLWADVDFDRGIFTVRDTKNGSDHTLPFSTYVFNIIRRRQRLSEPGDRYVFTGTRDRKKLNVSSQHLIVVASSGVEFSLHDLRRTFLTVAESLDLQYELIRSMANHKTQNITERYIIRSPERLKGPMESISQRLLELCGVKAEFKLLTHNPPKIN